MVDRVRRKRIVARFFIFLGMGMFFINLLGCGMEEAAIKKLKNIEFTVIDQSEIPQELFGTMEEKKKEGFKLTYADEKNLYIAVGYGEQKTGGYSISVDECYLAENAIYFGTTLTGPEKGEKVNEVASYPYIVVRAEYMDEPVVFE